MSFLNLQDESSKTHPIIENRLQKQYLNRLVDQLKKLRKFSAERNWLALRHLCGQIALGASTFHFPKITRLATQAQHTIPIIPPSRAATPPGTKEILEQLLTEMDATLLEDQLQTHHASRQLESDSTFH